MLYKLFSPWVKSKSLGLLTVAMSFIGLVWCEQAATWLLGYPQQDGPLRDKSVMELVFLHFNEEIQCFSINPSLYFFYIFNSECFISKHCFLIPTVQTVLSWLVALWDMDLFCIILTGFQTYFGQTNVPGSSVYGHGSVAGHCWM